MEPSQQDKVLLRRFAKSNPWVDDDPVALDTVLFSKSDAFFQFCYDLTKQVAVGNRRIVTTKRVDRCSRAAIVHEHDWSASFGDKRRQWFIPPTIRRMQAPNVVDDMSTGIKRCRDN